LQQISDLHGLLRENNMSLVSTAVISEEADANDIIARFKVSGHAKGLNME